MLVGMPIRAIANKPSPIIPRLTKPPLKLIRYSVNPHSFIGVCSRNMSANSHSLTMNANITRAPMMRFNIAVVDEAIDSKIKCQLLGWQQRERHAVERRRAVRPYGFAVCRGRIALVCFPAVGGVFFG